MVHSFHIVLLFFSSPVQFFMYMQKYVCVGVLFCNMQTNNYLRQTSAPVNLLLLVKSRGLILLCFRSSCDARRPPVEALDQRC